MRIEIDKNNLLELSQKTLIKTIENQHDTIECLRCEVQDLREALSHRPKRLLNRIVRIDSRHLITLAVCVYTVIEVLKFFRA